MKSKSNNKQNTRSKNTPSRVAKNARGEDLEVGRLSHLSRSVTDYGRCVANPFEGPQAGIPTYPTVKSLKNRVWAKGVFSTSSVTGFGFITVCPERFLFNDALSVRYSLASFPFIQIENTGTGVQAVGSNSTYNSGAIGSSDTDLQYRVVACGLRIRYIGSELNRGGQKVGFMDPTHDDVVGRDFTSIDGELDSVRFPVSREWHTVLYRPVSNLDLAYQDTSPGVIPAYMCFLVNGASAVTPLAYEFEVYAVGEFQGRNVRGMTVTPHDPVGFAATDYVLQTSRALLPSNTTGVAREGNIIGEIGKYISHGVSHITNHSHRQIEAHHSRSTGQTGASSGWWETAKSVLASASHVAMEVLPMLF